MAGLPSFCSVLRGVFFKEYVKLRSVWLLLLGLNAALMLCLYVETRHLFRLDHAEIVWYRVMGLGQLYYGALRFVPLLTGLALACLQFLPEMRDERMRLSLHLPAGSNIVVLAHLFIGLCGLAALMGLDAAALAWVSAIYFPYEACIAALFTFLPWVIAGFTAYLGVTLAFMEPRIKLRVFNLLLAGGLAAIMLRQAPPGAYAGSWPVLAAALPLLLLAALLPAYHFRHRRQE